VRIFRIGLCGGLGLLFSWPICMMLPTYAHQMRGEAYGAMFAGAILAAGALLATVWMVLRPRRDTGPGVSARH